MIEITSTLEILLVEDNCDDAELIEAALAEERLVCRIQRVETELEFQAALKAKAWHLIISDYTLPLFDGLTALQHARSVVPNIPFIFVSGTIGEDLAIETLKNGATDYVLKHRLSRLPYSVKRAIRESEEHSARLESERCQAEALEMETLLLEASPDATLIAGTDRVLRRVNRQMEIVFGYAREELVGKPIEVLLPERFRQQHAGHVGAFAACPEVRKMAAKRGLMGLRKNGQEFPVAVALSPMRTKDELLLVATVRDITEPRRAELELARHAEQLALANEQLRKEHAEREKVEAELRLAQKLEAIGQLAAGIAHEINTPMQFIGDGVCFLRDSFQVMAKFLPSGFSVQEHSVRSDGQMTSDVDMAELDYLLRRVPAAIDRTLEGIERVNTIVRAMKDFSHPNSEEKIPTDLNRALKNALLVSRHEYKYVADVEIDFEEIPPIPCYGGEINQVFLNLIVNAAHAIGDALKGTGRRGTIRVATSIEDGRVIIRIQDTGTGIPEPIRNRIFDPFFTTKEVGRGTGQGLALAHAIVVGKHGGMLSFETEVGRGTTFVIQLPADEHQCLIESVCQ